MEARALEPTFYGPILREFIACGNCEPLWSEHPQFRIVEAAPDVEADRPPGFNGFASANAVKDSIQPLASFAPRPVAPPVGIQDSGTCAVQACD